MSSVHDNCNKILEIIDDNSSLISNKDYLEVCNSLKSIYSSSDVIWDDNFRWFFSYVTKGFIDYIESNDGRMISKDVVNTISDMRAWDITMASKSFTKKLFSKARKWNAQDNNIKFIRYKFPSHNTNPQDFKYKYTCAACGFKAFRSNMVHEPRKCVHITCQHSQMVPEWNRDWKYIHPGHIWE
jgi:hypothetical protein